MIRVENVSKSFGSFKALDGLTLRAREGTVLGLLGPNGSGKTTTVKVLTTLLAPDSGDASVAGHSVLTAPGLVRSNLGLSGQYAAVDEKLTAFENLHMVGRLYGMNRRAAANRANELLESFRLTDVAGKRSGTFSGGMRRSSTWPAQSWHDPKWWSSMSPPPAWIRAAGWTPGTSCPASWPTAPPCS